MTKTEYMREWVKQNPIKWAKIQEKAQKKYRKTKKFRLTWNEQNHRRRFGGLRNDVLALDNYQCRICQAGTDLTVDHINRNRKNNTLNNLQTLCRPCHGRKDAHPELECH